MTSPNKFPITRQTLAEMAAIASKSTVFDTSKLTYTEVQQVLTIYSLLELLASYKIDLEIGLDIKELHAVNDDTKNTRT